jgi:hypothetical protein|tara:strand:- start:51 stop:968 length:918 start_codon:yes stop_codon:yes gene_type:complete
MSAIPKDNIISNIYYDLETGYGSVNSTLKQARVKDPTITLDDVNKWMSKQPNKQRKPYRGQGNSYVAPFARFEYQIDIMDMVSLQTQNNQPRYALVVIDIFSKLGDAQPLHNKDSISVYNALVIIFKKMGYPMSIYSDDDGAFKSKVKTFFDGEGINHIVTSTHANVAERWIRTLKNGIHDRVRFTKGKWEDMLKIVVNKYNNTIHSSTKLKPNEAHKDSNSPDVAFQLTVNSINKRKYPNINEGDEVKIYDSGQGKYANRKETKSKWSDTTYKVEKVDRDINLNKYYVLENLNRHYNRNELLLI